MADTLTDAADYAKARKHILAEQLTVEWEQQLAAYGFSGFVKEHRFHPTRKWRFDFSWPDLMLAVEIEGGTWSHGRHVTPQGFRGDAEKYNEAALGGWLVLRFTADMVRDGTAINALGKALWLLERKNLHLPKIAEEVR